MKMKGFIILALAATIALSGCSANKSGSGNEPTNSTNSGSSATPDASAAPVDLNWFATVGGWNPPQWNTDEGTVMGELTKKTGLTFSYNIPAQDGDTKLNLMMVSTSDAFPDVITTIGPDMGKKLVDAGKVWELEEFLKKYDPESHLLKDFPADVKEQMVKHYGGWYAIGSHMVSDDAREVYPPSSDYFADVAKYSENKGVIVNSNLLKEAGIELSSLKTEEGVLAALEKVKGMQVDGQPVIPLQIHGKNYHGETLQFLQRSFGAMPIDKDGKFRHIYMSPENKHAIQFLFKAAQGGYFDPGQMTTDDVAIESNLLSKRVFMFIGGTPRGKFDQLDFWVSPGTILSSEGTKPVFPFVSEPGRGWMQTMISKSTKEPEKLAKWLSFMTSPEGMTLSSFGIEGVHYTKDDKGLITRTEKGIQDLTDSSKTAVDIFWQFTNMAFLENVQPAPTKREGTGGLIEMEAKTAYARSPEVVRYDLSVTTLPGDFYAPGSENANTRDQIQQFYEAQVAKMVLAKDEAEFNKLYDEFIATMKKLKIDELNAELDAELQKKSQEMGVMVKGINS
ncbi:extracellular solute-binding protein [Paenibacillus harenae]|uniref:Aldouronate transport system substrate-binding protein n=1 Tax=Paenibacillus harenae TaxID=306543 RepID=A0ABT9UEE8_PAEHA|nr:extracellular solute-binding protein [Paenibacillus harenae]MDQ0116804.1 putative aldouronate transport system substrate-binding protein [Paenibacillus harenae]